MSDIEQAKRKLDICGYVHPTNTKSSKDKKYMTFDNENTENHMILLQNILGMQSLQTKIQKNL